MYIPNMYMYFSSFFLFQISNSDDTACDSSIFCIFYLLTVDDHDQIINTMPTPVAIASSSIENTDEENPIETTNEEKDEAS